jgi:hypothetical protein
MDNPETLTTIKNGQSRDTDNNQEWTIQRNWQINVREYRRDNQKEQSRETGKITKRRRKDSSWVLYHRILVGFMLFNVLVFYVVLCQLLIVFFVLFFWQLYCLSLFDLRLLIIPLLFTYCYCKSLYIVGYMFINMQARVSLG